MKFSLHPLYHESNLMFFKRPIGGDFPHMTLEAAMLRPLSKLWKVNKNN